ncbi:MAG: hypothetical protein OEZ13_01450 [Spirochaetia bacterium]|nr:hypothetical protein [Spirochaetia bacterium]
MTDNHYEFTFSETMSGFIALEKRDPKEAERAAKENGSAFVMNVSVKISDLEQFIKDPFHTAKLTGSIDFTEFGDNISVSNGKFNLFSPSEDPQMKYMIYEFNFSHENQLYFFSGKKELKDDPGLDLWEDTTTLFCYIFKGANADADITASGILKISLIDFIKMLRTMSAENAQSLNKKAVIFIKFGKFFLGNLWNTYGSFFIKERL